MSRTKTALLGIAAAAVAGGLYVASAYGVAGLYLAFWAGYAARAGAVWFLDRLAEDDFPADTLGGE